jgi:hypothetical protein
MPVDAFAIELPEPLVTIKAAAQAAGLPFAGGVTPREASICFQGRHIAGGCPFE